MNLKAGLLKRFLGALSALASGRLGQQAPDRLVACLQPEALDRLSA